jgi:hypothetical protein
MRNWHPYLLDTLRSMHAALIRSWIVREQAGSLSPLPVETEG